jgi:hypothetical protein
MKMGAKLQKLSAYEAEVLSLYQKAAFERTPVCVCLGLWCSALC